METSQNSLSSSRKNLILRKTNSCNQRKSVPMPSFINLNLSRRNSEHNLPNTPNYSGYQWRNESVMTSPEDDFSAVTKKKPVLWSDTSYDDMDIDPDNSIDPISCSVNHNPSLLNESTDNFLTKGIEKFSLKSPTGKYCLVTDSEDEDCEIISAKEFSPSKKVKSKSLCAKLFSTIYSLIKILVKIMLLAVIIIFISASYNNQTKSIINLENIEKKLYENVFGQDIAIKQIIYHISNHLNSSANDDTLILSLHGWTGTGKNYISQIIAEEFDSNSVQLLIPTYHYSSWKDHSNDFIKNIFNKISMYSHNLIVIDEIDKMTWNIEESLRPLSYLKSSKSSQHKTIIILLSNYCVNDINKYVYNWLSRGFSRNEMEVDTLTDILHNCMNAQDWYQSLRSTADIKLIPLIPLEKEHLEMCVSKVINSKQVYVDEIKFQHIINQFTFTHKTKPLFVVSGCKEVSSKVDIAISKL